ncbi:hypothetical protein BCR35DRAFT_330092 [Leucosporidium creatinivorum]|uniref:Uncharacterized protein n=1 Tax=Leucosporidium creatinivorum TaxID=106004 RepID=A0A1Y2FW09_9BASI|nr:hypothetical protein BCR35DRAFT_330092 [Leucosporidium creatinivorum]
MPPRQRTQQQHTPQSVGKQVAHDRAICAGVAFTNAVKPGIAHDKAFAAIGSIAVAAVLGRFEYTAHAVFNVEAREGAEEVNELVWERLTKMNIDVGLGAHRDLWQLITNLEDQGAGPDLSRADIPNSNKREFTGGFYRIEDPESKDADPDRRRTYWWGKRDPEGYGGNDVNIDLGKVTRIRHFMPAEFRRNPLKPFEYTELRAVYLRPKVPIGSIRIFIPIFVFLSKLIMPYRDRHKGKQDLLDAERLLTAHEEGLALGLDEGNLRRWLEGMRKKEFVKLETKVREWCKPDGSTMSQAQVMSDWEFQQLKFPKTTGRKKQDQIKKDNLHHWEQISSLIQTIVNNCDKSRMNSLAKAPFHVRSRIEQAGRLAALAERDDSVPTLRRSKRVRVFKSSV